MLSGLAIGSLSLNPTFDSETTSYTVSTSNKTNTIKATAESSTADVSIVLDNSSVSNEVVTNGNAVTWADGDNTLTITVTENGTNTVYTVIVTKS